jgi:hypothetical protein
MYVLMSIRSARTFTSNGVSTVTYRMLLYLSSLDTRTRIRVLTSPFPRYELLCHRAQRPVHRRPHH